MIGLGVAFLVLLGLMASGGSKAKAGTPGSPGTPGGPPTKGGIRVQDMPAALQQELAAALTALTVNADGKVVGPVDAAAIQLATATAGDLEKAGFADAAAALRAFIKAAATLVPALPPEKHIPLPSTMPADLQAQVNRALQLERDPAKLTAILNALKAYQPQTPDIQNAIQMLQALILQVQAQQSAKDALNQISTVVNTPPDARVTQPVPTPSGYLREGSRGPDVAAWQQIVGAKADGIFGPNTTALTKAWQSAHGLKPDGIVGPQTLAAARAASVPHPASPQSPAYPAPAVAPGAVVRTTIRQGSTGSDVKAWQSVIGTKQDGIFGPNTAALTKKWQSAHGLIPDGIVGPKTWATVGQPGMASQTVTTPLPDSPLSVPSTPVPGVSPTPRTPTEMAADAMVRNLKAVQAAYPFPSVKGKEDQSIVRRFQGAVGGGADGKAGPGTLLAAAVAGQSDLPLVMYWPTSATASRVLQYRNDINGVADRADAAGDHTGAALLRASASRERGQAGIVGPHPS